MRRFRGRDAGGGIPLPLHPSRPAKRQKPPRDRVRIVQRLRTLRFPLALYALDDLVAVNAIEICQDHGIRVPEDVAVLGTGNVEMAAEFCAVPLSSIETDWAEIVYRAAELLDTLMSGGKAPAAPLVFPPTGVVVRRSTDVVGFDHPYLAEAMAFVRDHFREPITVSHVARAMDVARRTLEKHFRGCLHYGLAEEIRRRRIDFAHKLLLETDLSVADVAQQSGFDSAVYMARAFKRILGVQPSHYRQGNCRPSPPRTASPASDPLATPPVSRRSP